MVCSLYEYFDSGICSTLEGQEGAYRNLETDMRMDRIISQMDIIIAKLDQIQANQHVLYSAICENNRELGRISNSIDIMSAKLSAMQVQGAQLDAQIEKLQQTLELSAYYDRRAQEELHYMNRMKYLSGRNDGVFFNAPPM